MAETPNKVFSTLLKTDSHLVLIFPSPVDQQQMSTAKEGDADNRFFSEYSPFTPLLTLFIVTSLSVGQPPLAK